MAEEKDPRASTKLFIGGEGRLADPWAVVQEAPPANPESDPWAIAPAPATAPAGDPWAVVQEAPAAIQAAPDPAQLAERGLAPSAPEGGAANDPRGLWNRISEGAAAGYGDKQTGFTEEDFARYPWMRDQRFLRSVAGAVDSVLRAPGGGIGAVAGTVGGVAEQLGMSSSGADALTRDISQILQVSMVPEVPKPTARQMTKPGKTLTGEKPLGELPPAVESIGAAIPEARPLPPGEGAPPAPKAAALTHEENTILSRVGRQQGGPGYTPTDFYTDYVDNLHPLKKAVEAAAEGRPIETVANPYEQFRLTRGSAGKAEHMLRYGALDFNTLQPVGEAFLDTMKPLRAERQQFTAYLMAKRALDLAERGVDTGIDLEAARAVADKGAARYSAPAAKLQAFQDHTLNYLRDSGVLSAEAVDAMRAASKDYLPLYRVLDEGGRAAGIGKKFNVFNPIKNIKGSERQVLDPLESIIRNTYVLTEMAERNRARATLVKFAAENPAMQLVEKVPTKLETVRVQPKEIQKLFDDFDIPQQFYGDPSGFDILRSRASEGTRPGEFTVYENGKRQVYKTDPDIAAAINGMDLQDLSLAVKLLAKPASWLRAGVVAELGYMARNLIRDQINAAVQSPNHYRPFFDFTRGLMQTVGKGEAYRNWLKSGGAQSTLVAQDRNYATDFTRKWGQPPTAMGRVKNIVTTPIELLREASETIDNATRVGEFMRATKGATDKASIMKGGMASRDVTQDFQRIGAKMRAMNAVTGFMNGQIQGIDREIGNLARRPGPALLKIAALVTVPSVYVWLAGKDDPRYQNAPNWEKDQYWLIMPEDKNAEPIRVPKPFTIGTGFGSSVERSLDAFIKDKPEAYKGLAKQLLGSTIPNFVPTFAVPIVEQWANKSQFLDRPLVGQRLSRLPAAEQFNPGTSETAKLVGKGISKIPGMEDSSLASPIILENYVRQWGGTLGRYALQGGDAALKALGVVDAPPGAKKRLSDIPVLRTFVSQYPSAGAQPIQDFYEKHAAIEKLFASGREARRKGDYNAELPARVAGYKKRLDFLQREIRTVQEARDKTPEQKRESINKAYLEMLDIAQQGLRDIRARGSVVRKAPQTNYSSE